MKNSPAFSPSPPGSPFDRAWRRPNRESGWPDQRRKGRKRVFQRIKGVRTRTAAAGLLVVLLSFGCMPPRQLVATREFQEKEWRLEMQPKASKPPDPILPGPKAPEAQETLLKQPDRPADEGRRLERLIQKLEETERRLKETQRKAEEALRKVEEAQEKTREAMERIEAANERTEESADKIEKAQERLEAVEKKAF